MDARGQDWHWSALCRGGRCHICSGNAVLDKQRVDRRSSARVRRVNCPRYFCPLDSHPADRIPPLAPLLSCCCCCLLLRGRVVAVGPTTPAHFAASGHRTIKFKADKETFAFNDELVVVELYEPSSKEGRQRVGPSLRSTGWMLRLDARLGNCCHSFHTAPRSR